MPCGIIARELREAHTRADGVWSTPLLGHCNRETTPILFFAGSTAAQQDTPSAVRNIELGTIRAHETVEETVAPAAHWVAMADKRMTKRIACERSESMDESVESSYLRSFELKRLKLWGFVGRPT